MRDPPKPFGSVSCTFYSYSVPTKKEKQPLSVTHPELAKEADGWDPETVSSGSGKKLSWKCSKKHSWDASVTNRALLGSGCPYCTRKIVIKGENDLASEHPELIDECDGWDPSEFFSGSNLKMPWVCKLGHRWEAKIVERALRNSKCPFCRNTKTLAGFNDLATLCPDLATEAHSDPGPNRGSLLNSNAVTIVNTSKQRRRRYLREASFLRLEDMYKQRSYPRLLGDALTGYICQQNLNSRIRKRPLRFEASLSFGCLP